MEKQPLRMIIIQEGDEYCSRVANIYEENAFFYPAYQQAGECVVEILNASKRFSEQFGAFRSREESSPHNIAPKNRFPAPYTQGWASKPASPHGLALSETAALASYPNNIIAFCGERGGGKTSAMVSFAKALEYFPQKPDLSGTAEDFWTGCRIPCTNYRFMVLDPIDPTLMEHTDSILWIILSRLFDKFQEQRDLQHQKVMDSSLLPLIDQFQECFKALDTLKNASRKKEIYYDDLSLLVDLGDSSRLKQKLKQLIYKLCSFFEDNRGEQWFLTLQIDDADLNSSHAYSIMEDLRKYMLLPNVIILMSVDLRQLELVVEQHFAQEFNPFIQASQTLGYGNAVADQVRCHSSAERYIDKLLPGRHQIHLPNVDRMLRDAWNRIGLSYLSTEGFDRMKPEESQEEPATEYQRGLLHLLYRKTRVILIEPPHKKHCFLPSTMRMLTHFLALFSELPDIPSKYTFEQLYLSPKADGNESESGKDGEPIPKAKTSDPNAESDEDDPSQSDITARIMKNQAYSLESTELQRARWDCIDNLERMDWYFRQIWCHMHLTAGQLQAMEKLFAVPLPELHPHCLHIIQSFLTEKSQIDRAECDIFEALCHLEKNLPDNLSKFKFAIEFYYTLTMHRWLITQKETDKKDKEEKNQTEKIQSFAKHIMASGEHLNSDKEYISNYIFFRFDRPPNDCDLWDNPCFHASCYADGTGMAYNLVRFMCSSSALKDIVTQYVDSTEKAADVLSPVQFMISTDVQNLFLETLETFQKPKEWPRLGEFLRELIEEFDRQLKARGSLLGFGKDWSNALDTPKINEFFTKLEDAASLRKKSAPYPDSAVHGDDAAVGTVSGSESVEPEEAQELEEPDNQEKPISDKETEN